MNGFWEKKKLLILALSAVVLRLLLWLLIPVTTDSAEHYAKARFIASEFRIPVFEYVTGNDPYWYPPMFHMVGAFFELTTGLSELTPLIAGLCSLLVFYMLVREFYPETLPYSFGLLVFLPFHAYMTGIGYVTILLFLWGVTGYYFYMKYLSGNYNTYLAMTLLSCAAAGLTHYHGLILTGIIMTHFFFQKPARAVTCFVIILVLISPWYVRNFIVFGNPIWPLFFEGNYAHAKTHGGYGFSGISNFFRPQTYVAVFFDFWIGAPNSGEDVLDNIALGRSMFPVLFELGFLLWMLVILAWSLFMLKGLKKFWGEKDYLPLLAVLFSFGIIPFLPSARIAVFSVPALVIAASKTVPVIRGNLRAIFFAFSIMAFVACTVSYAYVYHGIMSGVIPFYQQMEDSLPEGSRIVMPMTLQECIYYTSFECVRDRDFPGGVPPAVAHENPQDLKEYGITHFCCDSLFWDATASNVKNACTVLPDSQLVVDYEDAGSWGKCWSL